VKVVIVIPAYNEALTIRNVVQRALACGPAVVVVDDGSSDETTKAVADLPAVCLRHQVNRGKAAALATGFAWALANGAEAIVTLDADGQHRPEDIPPLLAVASQYPGRLVIAARLTGREAYPRARYFANRFADFWIAWAAGCPLVDSQCGQRVYPAALLRKVIGLCERSGGFTFESDVVIRASRLGFPPIAMPIAAIHLSHGRASHFRPGRDITRIVMMVAAHLLRTGFNPRGLWRSLRESPAVVDAGGSLHRSVRRSGKRMSPTLE
jgi:glycosyltransferase involved in cell wall biosynthesis